MIYFPRQLYTLLFCFSVSILSTYRCIGQKSYAAYLSDIIEHIHTTKPDSALSLVNRGINIILDKSRLVKEDSFDLAKLYAIKGDLLKTKFPKEAMNNYFEAKKLFQKIKYRRGTIISYQNLSNSSTNDEEKIKLALRALNLAECYNDTLFIVSTLNTLGVALKSGFEGAMIDSALNCYKKGLKLAKAINDSVSLAVTYTNMGNIYKTKNEYSLAMNCYYNSLIIANRLDDMVSSKTNLMSLYLKMDNLDSALSCYTFIEPHFQRRPELEEVYYSALTEYYVRSGDKAQAFDHFVKADSIEDFLNKDKDASALNLLEMEYQSQIQKERMALLNAQIEKSRYIRYLLICILGVILSFGGLAFYQYKQKIYKKKEKAELERQLMSEKLKHTEIKSKHLGTQLKYTSNELAYIAAGSVQNQKLLFDLKNRIESIYRKNDPKNMKQKLRELNIWIMHLINKDNDDRQVLVEKTEEVNTAFIHSLKEKFPNLSDNNMRLLVLLLLKFNSKDIASMYNIEEKSVMVRRHRLRKKLGVKKYESFEAFLKRTLQDIDFLKTESHNSKSYI